MGPKFGLRERLRWFWRYQVLARTSPRREGMSWDTYRRLRLQGYL